jgi:hypothetical protein
MRTLRVRALLMGEQPCVFYGAAEFSRDTDLAVVADAANVARLRRALDDLQTEVVAAPPFELKYLRRGHAMSQVQSAGFRRAQTLSYSGRTRRERSV